MACFLSNKLDHWSCCNCFVLPSADKPRQKGEPGPFEFVGPNSACSSSKLHPYSKAASAPPPFPSPRSLGASVFGC